ncbi:MAG TPA: hypothetical protein VFF13_00580 [archaeon]|nr:hypothetical protein [archaeon]
MGSKEDIIPVLLAILGLSLIQSPVQLFQTVTVGLLGVILFLTAAILVIYNDYKGFSNSET